MQNLVLTLKLQSDHTLVSLRDRTRQFGEVFGLESLQRTRLTTAVSEIGRNALQHANGAVVNFLVGEIATRKGADAVIVQVIDRGPGVAAPHFVGRGSQPPGGPQHGGIQGSRRLVDGFWMESGSEGTMVVLEMLLPREAQRLTEPLVAQRIEQLIRRRPQSPREELELQNREMLHTLEELRRRQRDLELADERKNEFVAMLAHELRNPLAAITMALELMRRKQVLSADEIGRYRETIGRQTGQLTRLVNDLMDVSRVTRGKIELERKVVDMNALVAHAVEMTRAFIDAKQHSLTVRTPAVPMWVDVDEVRMKQVISNLLHNAARYTPASGVLRITVSANDHSVAVSVSDNGMGIDSAMIPKVFDLFIQGDSTLAREDSGLGIGLTIVQRLVREHGGSVSVTSEGLNRGSDFVLMLPLVAEPASPEGRLPEAASQVARRRLLLVDDNRDALLATKELLELSGCECAAAFDGASGLALALDWKPEVAILDIGLPLIDGLALAQRLRAELGDKVTLVALSGYSAPVMQERALASGFDHYLIKPVDVSALMQIILEAPDAAGKRPHQPGCLVS